MDARTRREHLKRYILACVRDNAMTWADLASPDKFLAVLSRDTKAVLQELGRESCVGLMQVGASLLTNLVGKLKGA